MLVLKLENYCKPRFCTVTGLLKCAVVVWITISDSELGRVNWTVLIALLKRKKYNTRKISQKTKKRNQ